MKKYSGFASLKLSTLKQAMKVYLYSFFLVERVDFIIYWIFALGQLKRYETIPKALEYRSLHLIRLLGKSLEAFKFADYKNALALPR